MSLGDVNVSKTILFQSQREKLTFYCLHSEAVVTRQFFPKRIDEGLRPRNICKPSKFWFLDLRKPKVVNADVKRNFLEVLLNALGGRLA